MAVPTRAPIEVKARARTGQAGRRRSGGYLRDDTTMPPTINKKAAAW